MIKGKGGNSAGVPPLPIPNRAVKPRRADGTGKPGEQVAAPFRERSGDRRRSASTSFFMPILMLFLTCRRMASPQDAGLSYSCQTAVVIISSKYWCPLKNQDLIVWHLCVST